MEILRKLESITQELFDLLQVNNDSDRDKLIEEITTMVEQRDSLIVQLPTPFNVEEKKVVEKIMKQDEFIKEQMAIIFKLVKKDIALLKQQKLLNKGYNNPYQSLNNDGMFFDKKK